MNSGLVRQDKRPSEARQCRAGEETTNEPRFSLKGLKDVYTAFGGGSALCPGRHFAEQEVLNTFARLALLYDIELEIPPAWEPRMDPDFFPNRNAAATRSSAFPNQKTPSDLIFLIELIRLGVSKYQGHSGIELWVS